MGEKQKFDLIAASKTKKYKIIMGVVLGFGLLLFAVAFLLRMSVTSAVTPNSLSLRDLNYSTYISDTYYECTITKNETFFLSTGTPLDRPLTNSITFTLDAGAKLFLEEMPSSHYINQPFELRIKADAPELVANEVGEMVKPTGNLTINCGNHMIRIKFTYVAK